MTPEPDAWKPIADHLDAHLTEPRHRDSLMMMLRSYEVLGGRPVPVVSGSGVAFDEDAKGIHEESTVIPSRPTDTYPFKSEDAAQHFAHMLNQHFDALPETR